MVYSFAGLNSVSGHNFENTDDDKYCAAVVRPFLKRNFDIRGTSVTELMLRTILTS